MLYVSRCCSVAYKVSFVYIAQSKTHVLLYSVHIEFFRRLFLDLIFRPLV